MNQCTKCGNVSYSDIVIHTETTFGHGDSSHKCYTQCKCGHRTKEFWGYGLFDDVTFRKAQAAWNDANPVSRGTSPLS